jgi:hypothetical protein
MSFCMKHRHAQRAGDWLCLSVLRKSSTTRVLDKIGLYFQQTGGESETVYESGLTRSSHLATAKSTLH